MRKVNPICGVAVTTRIRMMGNRGKNVSFDGVQPWRGIIRCVEKSKVLRQTSDIHKVAYMYISIMALPLMRSMWPSG